MLNRVCYGFGGSFAIWGPEEPARPFCGVSVEEHHAPIERFRAFAPELDKSIRSAPIPWWCSVRDAGWSVMQFHTWRSICTLCGNDAQDTAVCVLLSVRW